MAIKTNRPHLSQLESEWQKFWKYFWNGSKPAIVTQHCVTGRVSSILKRQITSNIIVFYKTILTLKSVKVVIHT